MVLENNFSHFEGNVTFSPINIGIKLYRHVNKIFMRIKNILKFDIKKDIK